MNQARIRFRKPDSGLNRFEKLKCIIRTVVGNRSCNILTIYESDSMQENILGSDLILYILYKEY